MAKMWEFDAFIEEGDEDFASYVERFGHYCKVAGVQDEELKKSAFISAIGKKAYKTLKDLLLPAKPEEKTFEDLVKVLSGHYEPSSQVIAERFKFNRRYQGEGESVAAFAVTLKHMAAKCNYGTFLDDALRDRFVAGLRNSTIQTGLLKRKELTFESACVFAKSVELAERESRGFRPTANTDADIHALKKTGKEPEFASKPKNSSMQSCYRCGQEHDARCCRYRKFKCHLCKRVGHLARMCRCKQPAPGTVHNVSDEASGGTELLLHGVYLVGTEQPYEVEVQIAGQLVKMQVDTGAAVSLVPECVYRQLKQPPQLAKCEMKLKTYGGATLQVKGQAEVLVDYKGQRKVLPIIVVPGEKPALLGRDWIANLGMDLNSIHEVHAQPSVDSILSRYASVFSPGLGLIKGYQAKLVLKEGSMPVFCKARSVPYAIREPVEHELGNLQKEGVLVPVTRSDWATPLVAVHKPDGTVRLCGDYKLTVNPCVKTDHYPLPAVEDLFTTLAGGKVFTVLDLSTAYQQIEVHPDSRPLLTINSHMGLFQYVRMPYGISSAPAVFQAIMNELLKGLPGVVCYLDDVLITGASHTECLARVEAVLQVFRDHGVKVRKEKCKFFLNSVKYLGHIIDENGVHPCVEKVEAIREAPTPKNISELKAYLGMITFYSKFMPNMSSRLKPLYALLQKDKKWVWSAKEEKAFAESKSLLTQASVLTFYDPKKPLGLVCDASPYGVGAVLFHVVNGEERPIAYASRTLSKAESGYAHIEKEALAVIFGIKRFHKYLYGREFTIYSDHLPLEGLLGQTKPIQQMAAARMQRWMLVLAAYRYKWVYRKGAQVANADALSRLPLPNDTDESDYVHFFSAVEAVPLSAKRISDETQKDPVLSKVLMYVLNGWPSYVSEDNVAPFFSRKDELSVDCGCITWGTRVVIPEAVQSEVLSLLHEGHPGITRMKMLSRSHVWWPKLCDRIEETVRGCSTCQLTQNSAPHVPMLSWGWPTRRWQRVHLDFAYYKNDWFLVLVDAHSKWVDVLHMNSTTAQAT